VEHQDFSRLPDEALIRLVLLKQWGLIPFSVATLWRKIREGAFPPPVKVSAQITAFRAKDVREWLAEPGTYRAPRPSEAAASGVKK